LEKAQNIVASGESWQVSTSLGGWECTSSIV